MVSPRAPDCVEYVEVIHVAYLLGTGIEDDPCRLVHSYYSRTGELLATRDPWKDGVPSVAPNIKAVA